MENCSSVVRAFRESDPIKKARYVGLISTEDALRANESAMSIPGLAPGRPLNPILVEAARVPRRSPHTPKGHAALLHAIAHIEFNAINLALDAIWRFPGLPDQYYLDWLRVAKDEARHFVLLVTQLESLEHTYGDFPAHNGLWAMCEKTQHDPLARMALVPRTLEARGLDATPAIQAKLLKVGTAAARASSEVLDIILADEVGHVAIGNFWYRWLCEKAALDPLEHYAVVARQYVAPVLKPPFNLAARRKAGFSEEELDLLGS